MTFLCHYLNSHPSIRHIVYLLGKDSSLLELESLLSSCAYDDLLVCFEDENIASLPSGIHVVGKEELPTFKDYHLFVDHYENNEELLRFSRICFASITVYMGENYDSFALWEACYPLYSQIVIARYVDDYRNEVLSWEKGVYEKELSIVFPVYNVEPYLLECLDSVCAWKAPYVEFLFVSDGSTDQSVALLRKYAETDSRVKIYEKENGGCASARQYGLERAKGRYIGFVDPDDFVDPTMFKKLLSRAMSGSYDIAYCGYNEYYQDSGKSEPVEDLIGFPYDRGVIDEGFVDELIAFRRIAIWRGIYASSLLSYHRLGFHTELRRFDDLPFKVETLAKAKTVVSVPEYLYYYRLGRKGQDVSADDKRLYVHFDIFKILDAFFASPRSSRQLDLYQIVKTQTHAWALTRLRPEFKDEYRALAASDIGIRNSKRAWCKAIRDYGGEKAAKEYLSTYTRPKKHLGRYKVSIVIPIYNKVGRIKENLAILSSSKGLRYEVLLVDDGSANETVEALRKLVSSYPKARLITLPHKGVSSARNAGIKEAKGDYVWFVDSDDLISVSLSNIFGEAFVNKKVDLLSFDAEKRNVKSSKIASYDYENGNFLEDYLREASDVPYVWNKLYARSFLLENHIAFDERVRLGEDALFNVLSFQKAKKVKTIHQVLYSYFEGEGSSAMAVLNADPDAVLVEHTLVATGILEALEGQGINEETKRVLAHYLDCLLTRPGMGRKFIVSRDKLIAQVENL